MSGASPSPELMAEAEEFLSRFDIADVHPTSISAELVGPRTGPVDTVGFETNIEYSTGVGAFRSRVTFSFEMKDSTDEPIAVMKFVVVVEWVGDGEHKMSSEVIDFVTSTTGYFAAFPYARELAQSASARLGLDPLVLGILNRGQLKPNSISVVRRSHAAPETYSEKSDTNPRIGRNEQVEDQADGIGAALPRP